MSSLRGPLPRVQQRCLAAGSLAGPASSSLRVRRTGACPLKKADTILQQADARAKVSWDSDNASRTASRARGQAGSPAADKEHVIRVYRLPFLTTIHLGDLKRTMLMYSHT